jgi:hypothetical protein
LAKPQETNSSIQQTEKGNQKVPKEFYQMEDELTPQLSKKTLKVW